MSSTGGRITSPRWYRSRSPTPPSVAVAAVVAAAVAAESAAAGGGKPGAGRGGGGGVDGDDVQVAALPPLDYQPRLCFGSIVHIYIYFLCVWHHSPGKRAGLTEQSGILGVFLGLNGSLRVVFLLKAGTRFLRR